MKPPSDPTEDPRLTAHVLGEPDAGEANGFAREIDENPALAAEAEAIAAMARCLSSHLALPPVKLHSGQRDALLQKAREADRRRKILRISSAGEGVQNWFIPAAAAAVLLVATTIFIRMSAKEAPPAASHGTSAGAPLVKNDLSRPKPVTARDRPGRVLIERGLANAAEFPTLRLPVSAGQPGLQPISKFILNGKKPPREVVRIEDMLNTFAFRLNGVTAIARANVAKSPDNRDEGIGRHVATLSSELIACPWKPSATLLFVSIRGNTLNPSDIKLTFHANAQNVSRYRLLGFVPVAEGSAAPHAPSTLAANTAVTLALEIDPSKSEGDLGFLEWSANGEAAPSLPLVYRRAAEPSDDSRFAALVCTYGQWLTGERAGLIDPEILAGLSRELASATLPPDRADFLKLINQSLRL